MLTLKKEAVAANPNTIFTLGVIEVKTNKIFADTPAYSYTIATSDFLVSRSGDGYTMFKEGKVVALGENTPKDSDAFEAAIKAAGNSTISPTVEGRIVRLN